MYGMTLSVKENDYILAQRSIGSSSARTIVNIFSQRAATHDCYVNISFGGIIMAESGLSQLLGVGITAPDVVREAWLLTVLNICKHIPYSRLLGSIVLCL